MAAAPDLTFDEAAEFLGLTPDEFKRRLKLHPAFKRLDVAKKRDGTSFRFPRNLIEEVARELGEGSNAENPLPGFAAPPPDSDDFKIPAGAVGKAPKSDDEPIDFGSSGDDDVFSLAADEPKPAPKPTKGDSDSDVRLDGGKPKKPRKGGSDAGAVPTEEISIDFSGPGSAVIKGGSSAKLSAPKSSGKLTSDSGKGLAKPGVGDSSEFELSLDADSDDFELKLNTDASDEVDLGELPKDKDGGSGRRGGESGILSRKPADSGISLEKGKDSDKLRDKGKGKDSDKIRGKPAPPPAEESSDSDVDFELTLDSAAAVSGTKLGGPKSKKITVDSDSEFELTLDDASESSLESAALGADLGAEGDKEAGDIFETDFEIPPMDESGSEAVALEESDTEADTSDSDFEVELDDSDTSADDTSGSEVVLLEDEEAEAAPKPKGKKKPAPVEEEGDVDLADVEAVDEDEESAAGALKGVKHKRGEDEDEEEEAVGAGAGAYRPVPWGPLPALFLLPAMLLVLMGGLMGYELLQTMWGYQQPRKPSAPLVRAIAQNLDMELKDQ